MKAPLSALLVLLCCASSAFGNPSSINAFLGRGAVPAVFRSTSNSGGGGAFTTVTKPAGVAVGDIVIVVDPNARDLPGTLTSGGGTWSSFLVSGTGTNCGGSACFNSVYWKKLVLADLSGSWSFSGTAAAYVVLDYIGNGATSVSLRETEQNFAAGNLVFTGYTPALSTRGSLGLNFTGATGAVPPTGFTTRSSGIYYGGPDGFFTAADKLNYQSGGSTWTNLTSATLGGLLEIYGP